MGSERFDGYFFWKKKLDLHLDEAFMENCCFVVHLCFFCEWKYRFWIKSFNLIMIWTSHHGLGVKQKAVRVSQNIVWFTFVLKSAGFIRFTCMFGKFREADQIRFRSRLKWTVRSGSDNYGPNEADTSYRADFEFKLLRS